MPRTSADQCQQSPKLDRIGNPTAEDWAIAGCANLARARRAVGSARADYRSSLAANQCRLTTVAV